MKTVVSHLDRPQSNQAQMTMLQKYSMYARYNTRQRKNTSEQVDLTHKEI